MPPRPRAALLSAVALIPSHPWPPSHPHPCSTRPSVVWTTLPDTRTVMAGKMPLIKGLSVPHFDKKYANPGPWTLGLGRP